MCIVYVYGPTKCHRFQQPAFVEGLHPPLVVYVGPWISTSQNPWPAFTLSFATAIAIPLFVPREWEGGGERAWVNRNFMLVLYFILKYATPKYDKFPRKSAIGCTVHVLVKVLSHLRWLRFFCSAWLLWPSGF